MYPSIDMERTGLKLKAMFKLAGYDVKDIQEYLHLACPQSIYRWLNGKTLPSVEHLCALSLLLKVHVEELLVLGNQTMFYGFHNLGKDSRNKRLLTYYDKFVKYWTICQMTN